MRANDKNFTITPYAEYNRLDVSAIKIKEPDHLFDVDPANRKSNKRPYIDKDAVATTTQEVTIPTKMEFSPSVENKGATIQQLIEQKEKARGTKRPKLFDYDDEW